MPALAERYLGKAGMVLVFLGIVVYIYGALAGYLSAGGNLLFELSGGRMPFWLGTVIYFAVSTFVVVNGLRMTGLIEMILFSAMIIFVFTIAGMASPHLNPELIVEADWSSLPSIFGVVLFAYAGHVVIPSVARGMQHDKKGLVISTILGLLLPMVIYIFWSLIFTMVIPRGNPGEIVPYSETATLFQARHYGQPATIPLGHLIGGSVVLIGSLFAILSTFTSYLGFGLSSIDCWTDAASGVNKKLPRWAAILLTIVVPLSLSLFNPASFLVGIEIGGMYGGSLFAGLIPPLMVLQARKKGALEPGFSVPGGNWLPVLVFCFFAAGVLLRTWQLIF